MFATSESAQNFILFTTNAILGLHRLFFTQIINKNSTNNNKILVVATRFQIRVSFVVAFTVYFNLLFLKLREL